MTVFPTGYTDKGSTDNTDIIWASDEVTNFNITVDNIGDRVFTDRDTDDLSEGVTNTYYSDAQVAVAPAVTQNASDILLKADITNVIEKDSIVPFTPTLDTHPANKGYVDNFNIPDATEVTKGKARLSTDVEAREGTDDTIIMTPKKTLDNYGIIIGAGTTYTANTLPSGSTLSSTLVKIAEEVVKRGATYSVSFGLNINGSGGSANDRLTNGQIFVNNIAVGTLRASTFDSSGFEIFTEDITVNDLDLIQLYISKPTVGFGASAQSNNMTVKYKVTGFNAFDTI